MLKCVICKLYIAKSKFIVDSTEEHRILPLGMKEVLHGLYCGASGNEVIKYNHIVLTGNVVCIINSSHALLRAAMRTVVVERNAQGRSYLLRDTRSEVPLQMPSHGRSDYSPIPGRKIVADHFMYDRHKILHEVRHHTVIAFDVSQCASEHRLLPDRDEVS